MNAASGGQRELRLDTETGSCGRYVEIMSVQLPRTAAEYGIDLGSVLEKLEDDLEAKLSSPTQRNYVVWADLSCDSRCNGGVARTGFTFKPRLALVFGDNGTGSTFQFGLTTTFDVVAPLHEMLHTIGAVNGQAPHVTRSGGSPLGHCWQEDDLMCQNEGDVPPQLDCPGQGGFDSLVVDCGQDDYFNVDPPAGSFLASNPFANTATSRFMIGAPTAALAVSKSSATAGETITLDASGSKDDNIDAATFTWDFEGDGVADQTTTSKSITHVYPAESFRRDARAGRGDEGQAGPREVHDRQEVAARAAGQLARCGAEGCRTGSWVSGKRRCLTD